ncbi:hypothetical protein CBER1_06638 [Cercospora berteroae]|uniref:DNA2/NAM7 helicase-like C-terminal domain-containing protein n=1 Tax=Cercospora berteroae TaxID=357750 RepID=A0A2S6C4C8_9PEZI|nr:hypothetical protein CBER1_06638 [Cercospora berteroae]
MVHSPLSTPPMATTPEAIHQQYWLPLDNKKPRDSRLTATDDINSEQWTPVKAPDNDPRRAHFQHVLDFDTRGPVTFSTRLGSLYRYNDPKIDNRGLRNVNGKSEPRIPAQMLVKIDGQWSAYPPSLDVDYRYRVWVRFNTLNSAPALSNFAIDVASNSHEPSVFVFEVNGASSEGLTRLDIFAHLLDAEQMLAAEMVKSQCNMTSHRRIAFSIDIHGLAPYQREGVDQITQQLPNGGGTLLPSIGREEWSNLPSTRPGQEDHPDRLHLGNVKALMENEHGIPNLMLEQDCGITFSSLAHFFATHEVAEIIANDEGSRELQLWAKANHKVTLYEVNGHVVIAMIFGRPLVLPNGQRLPAHPKIPNDLEVMMVIRIPGLEQIVITACHERDLMGLGRHSACFKVTSPSLEVFARLTHDPEDPNPTYSQVLSLCPHVNSFWVGSVRQTSRALCAMPRWHALMLGQSFDTLDKTDVIAALNVEEHRKTSAKKWLLAAKQWNAEQRLVIDSMHEALGGVSLCTGFAGTGKTTLILATAVYFVKLGGRAFVSAAENGHVESMARAVSHILDNVTRPDGKPIKLYIVQSLSRGKRLGETTAAQAEFNKKGHLDGGVGGLDNYKFASLTEEVDKDEAWKYMLCNAVAEEADNGERSFFTRLRDARGRKYGPKLDIWKRFRELCRDDDLDEIDWDDEDVVLEYKHVLAACEGDLIYNADIIITTTCNARCKELVRYWGEAVRESGLCIKALGVFIDSADSCRTMETWNVITSSALPRSPDLVMLAGNIRLLGPVNTSANQKPFCNPTAASLSRSELGRIVELNHPSVRLVEQRYMNSELARFPSLAFYDNEIRTGRDRDQRLDRQFDEVLQRTAVALSKFKIATLGEKVRQCYFEISSGRVEFNDKKSAVIPEHVEICFSRILPALQGYFGDQMSKEVIIIAAYAHARTKYTECMHGLQEEQGFGNEWYPRIISVDGSKGHTATMTIFDGSMKYGDRMGFLKDAGRCNVAMTRATEVFWMIGGSLLPMGNFADEDAPFYQLREQLMSTGQVIQCATPKLNTINRLITPPQGHGAASPQNRDLVPISSNLAFRR